MGQSVPLAKIEKLLLSTDGSEYSEGAVREAVKLAKLTSAILTVIAVIETNPEYEALAPDRVDKADTKTREYLDTVKKMASLDGVECETLAFHSENVFRTIVEEAEKRNVDMIVMGRRGRTGLKRLLMGSVTAKVIGHSPCDVLVVPKAAEIGCRKILVATDGSKYSLAAASEAIGIAKRCGAFLYVVSALPSESSPFDIVHSEMLKGPIEQYELREAEKNVKDVMLIAEQEGIPARTIVESGPPYKAILEAAEKEKIDLIIMGSHGRTGMERLLMGSVAERVVGHAACAVLIVKK
jgi:nucleotide-binding universal stress UspA family protein